MYQKPDFLKVSVKVKDAFSSYASCQEIWVTGWHYTVPCEGTEDYAYGSYPSGMFTNVV